MPGEQRWKEGVSSLLFGTNDTQEWSQNNIETNPAFQASLKEAHFTLMRTFFFDHSLADGHATSDAELEQRLRTIEQSGMTCLGVLANIFDVAFLKHVVSYAGSRCLLYEFGNEPDYNGISSASYLKQWNSVIPQLRQLNPQARFIGPVISQPSATEFLRAFLQGVRASGVLPDAISFHWYPCWQNSESDCLKLADSATVAIQGVRSLTRQILGRELPIGITEWNFDPGNPPPAYGEKSDFITAFTRQALQAMISGGLTFACQFDAASYAGYGHLDLFDVETNAPRPQYYAMRDVIAQYYPGSAGTQARQPSSQLRASPLVSRGKPAFCSANDDGPGGPAAIVDGHYGNWAFWHGTDRSLPSWCAIHVGSGPSRLLLIWTSDYVFDYLSDSGPTPRSYTIAVSANSSNGSDGSWKTLATVSANRARNREHLLSFSGMSWVKMTVTGVQPGNREHEFLIDEIDLFDVSSQTALNDSFFCLGTSITALSFNRFAEHQPALPELVHAAYPADFPALVNGGIGGQTSTGMLDQLDTFLALNPDMHYWLIEVGTNDAFGQVSPATYRQTLQQLVTRIKQAGHVPVLALAPYSNRTADSAVLNAEIEQLNRIVLEITQSAGLMKGPDLYSLFRAHPDYLSADGIHPSDAGAIAINRAWFEALQGYRLWS
ncbi:SGNH/GDSL hydrolase family protein [Thermogemmatispora sp.]|uniref:SGNH/GDSL hydrolase family protein n=1 Tax=Thermogemmatispora sp. TaxID=1968838 RepID=UPI001D4ABB99|nr:GDSL-type esterase/lipase family protein [Thermogemmatispora sp.]MBX5450689.1 SGNH/GDSL hydrolase family protein [Thermogemmatispora sp.]